MEESAVLSMCRRVDGIHYDELLFFVFASCIGGLLKQTLQTGSGDRVHDVEDPVERDPADERSNRRSDQSERNGRRRQVRQSLVHRTHEHRRKLFIFNHSAFHS